MAITDMIIINDTFYKMAENIASGIEKYISYLENKDNFSIKKSFGA